MYEWMKAFHIMSVLAWMAGLFYLPRLMVYHADAETGSELSETFKIMERRLLKAIMTPSMIASWIFGLATAYAADFFTDGWFHIKLLLVFLMSAYHGVLARHVREFAGDNNQKSSKYYRIINELPTLLMVAIVLIVVFKPFL
ncbi:protoporphyrinogen oxidase HemJ [Coralliovum pocilloporae]|uniref:protoporphyrinogen oxidase HemJ n=1 Tax=Coralliovum pocilloporae TaxID=3066369 RepID=UPI003306EAD0